MTNDKNILNRVFLLFIPVAFASYLFHEFGHWSVGELLGNNMVYNLNLVYPKSRHYIDTGHDLFISIGDLAYTIILALLFLLVIEKYKTLYAYLFVIFQLVMRAFSLGFGGFSRQDEARISSLLHICD